ncbi:uncharacterized protein [Pyrus communis]|uniref:uncharacterized protein isoform X1 n=1 Tax=Pyrus communis TaxID=23211 RepID=UPI0035C1D882
MPRGRTFATIILTISLLILAVSANLRDHILHVNHVDATNANANPNDKSQEIANAADHIGKAVKGIANTANSLLNNLATALKPNTDNFTEYPRPALVQEFLMAHNEIRREEKMKPLVWNDTMAQLAEDWAMKQDHHDCQMQHSSYQGMGENLFWAYKAHWLPREAVHDWGHEKVYYNKEKRECEPDKPCAHYTQIIWKDTEQVGCARHKCSNENLLVVCEYYPPGNWVGMDPFNPIPLSQLAHHNLSTTAPSPPASSLSRPPPPSSSNGEASNSGGNHMMKRKGNKGGGHHVPRGQNGQGQGQKGNQAPTNQGQGQKGNQAPNNQRHGQGSHGGGGGHHRQH